jgi:hypothetical protein
MLNQRSCNNILGEWAMNAQKGSKAATFTLCKTSGQRLGQVSSSGHFMQM